MEKVFKKVGLDRPYYFSNIYFIRLDDDSKEIVHQLIKRVHEQGTTIIRVTHDQSEIQTAGHIMQIKQGRIIK